ADVTHLGFGAGTHMCLGAHLARMETQEALGALIARTCKLERVDPVVAWGTSIFRVPGNLPVRISAA
ncbi:MAG: cytochrome P450, partial [Deltaproteobacteria bacterium]|nr:cytochrome P450 [Deltaproteobacteria bacterium]